MVEELLMNDDAISQVLNRFPKVQWPHLIHLFTLYGIKMLSQSTNFGSMSVNELERLVTSSPIEFFIKQVEDIRRTLHKLDKRMIDTSLPPKPDIPLQTQDIRSHNSRKHKVKSMNRNTHGALTTLANNKQLMKENNFVTERRPSKHANEPDVYQLFTERRKDYNNELDVIKPTPDKSLPESYKKATHKAYSRLPSEHSSKPMSQYDAYEKEMNKLRRIEAISPNMQREIHKGTSNLDKEIEGDYKMYNRLQDVYKAAASTGYTYTRTDSKKRSKDCEFTLGGAEYVYDPIN